MIENEYLRRLKNALFYMENNYSGNIRLEDIAASANFSPFHFHRIFSSLYGETPGEYLRRLRLEKSAELLNTYPDYSITRIAMETGFSSSSVFARAFQNNFGTTASAFRKKSVEQRMLRSIRRPVASLNRPEREFPLVEIRLMEPLDLYYVRSMTGYNTLIQKAWSKLFSWAFSRGVIRSGTRLFGIPMDDPEITNESKCRYFASLSSDDRYLPLEPDAPVEWMHLDKGWYAVFLFKGEPSEIPLLYRYVYGVWLPESGYQPDNRPSLEEYSLNNLRPGSPSQTILEYSLLLPIRSL